MIGHGTKGSKFWRREKKARWNYWCIIIGWFACQIDLNALHNQTHTLRIYEMVEERCFCMFRLSLLRKRLEDTEPQGTQHLYVFLRSINISSYAHRKWERDTEFALPFVILFASLLSLSFFNFTSYASNHWNHFSFDSKAWMWGPNEWKVMLKASTYTQHTYLWVMYHICLHFAMSQNRI